LLLLLIYVGPAVGVALAGWDYSPWLGSIGMEPGGEETMTGV